MTNAFEAEKSVLGAMLIDSRAAAVAFSEVDVDDFSTETLREVYKGMLKLRSENQPIDAITLVDILEAQKMLTSAKWFTLVTDLSIFAISAANIEQHIAILHKARVNRELKAAITSIAKDLEDGEENALETAKKRIYDIQERRTDLRLEPIGDSVLEAVGDFLQNRAKDYVATKFHDLDSLLKGGLQRKNLIILAARPSMGKTAFAVNVGMNVAAARKHVIIFSLEQSRAQLELRMVSAHEGIDMMALRANYEAGNEAKYDADLNRVSNAASYISTLPMCISDTAQTTVNDMRASLMQYRDRNPLDLVIIDHLGLIGHKSKNERQDLIIGEMTRLLKITAKELDVPILLLVQLNRALENRGVKTPQLSDLRDSGRIEEDADVAMFLHRPFVYGDSTDESEATLFVRKHRDGPIGDIELHWNKHHVRFTSVSRGYSA